MQGKWSIREAKLEDAAELLAIYAPYVEKTAITFEYTVPSVAEFAERMQQVQQRYPYLVAEQDGKLLGYVYAEPLMTGRWKPLCMCGRGSEEQVLELLYMQRWKRVCRSRGF